MRSVAHRTASQLTLRRETPTLQLPVRAKLVRVLIVFALVCAIGGHWAILQSVAWVGMVMNYSQSFPLQEALVKTFDGKHPCKICKVVQAGRSAEKKPESLKVETKLDFFLVSKQVIFLLTPQAPFQMANISLMPARSESPPTPPPRPLLG